MYLLSIHFTALSCVTGPVDVRSSLIRHAWLLVMLRPILYAPYRPKTCYLLTGHLVCVQRFITEIAANSLLPYRFSTTELTYPTISAAAYICPILMGADIYFCC